MPDRRRLLCLSLLVLALACERWPQVLSPRLLTPSYPPWNEDTFAHKAIDSYTIGTPAAGAPADAIVGKRRTYTVRDGDTLLDVARYFDLGYNEITEANPGVDPWVPKVGTQIVVPTEWILPCCTYEGLVVNIPEMRLFFYRHKAGAPGTTIVQTFPVGLGRDDRRTPRGRWKVRGKTVNPQWNIPESIRQEHIRERGDARTFIRGGDPDNPLGKYRLELTRPLYTIHGTDIAWGVGMEVSHGCVRLYPEDIERLFPLVAVGTPVEFTYQPVKVAASGGAAYVEVHRDIYRYGGSAYRRALAALERLRLGAPVDHALLEAAVKGSTGLPVRVSEEPTRARHG